MSDLSPEIRSWTGNRIQGGISVLAVFFQPENEFISEAEKPMITISEAIVRIISESGETGKVSENG